MSDWVKEGQKAPVFRLKSDTGTTVSLSDYRGRPVVVYFYPRDNTPGCTREACAFRDCLSQLRALGVELVGISPDSVESHRKFKEKHDLNFPLLSDPDHTVASKYGAWREKTMYGKKTFGIQRSTFLIDAQGKVARAWQRVQVDGHDQEVLEAARQLVEGCSD